MIEKKYLSWDQYNGLVDQLIDKFITNNDYQYICGIPRGGLMLAMLLSYKTNIQVITPSELSNLVYIDHIDKDKILVVDDIIDSGNTLKSFIANQYNVATLYKQRDCKVDIKNYIEINDQWIVFPYENDNDTLSEVNIDNIQQRRNQSKEN